MSRGEELGASEPSKAPRWILLLAPALALHVAEEWWGGPGLSAWAEEALGLTIPPESFLAINAVGVALLSAAIVGAVLSRRLAWLAVSVATLVVVNGAIHLLLRVGAEITSHYRRSV